MIPPTLFWTICLAFLGWMLTSCQGRVVIDVGKTDDGEWPVLCPPDTFYSKTQEECMQCSTCPINNIITSPCHGLYDTQCGPFVDFKSFYPPGSKNDEGDNHDSDSNSQLPEEPIIEFSSFREGGDLSSEEATDSDTSAENFDIMQSGWGSLSVTLTIVISAIFIGCLVIGTAILFFRKRLQGERKLGLDYSLPPENV